MTYRQITANGNVYNNSNVAPGGMADGGYVDNFFAMIGDVMVDLDARLVSGKDYYRATSTSTATIGAGAKSITVSTGKGFAVGDGILARDSANAARFMVGSVTAYTAGSGALTFSVAGDGFAGTGSCSSWIVSGPIGPRGAQGLTGLSYAWDTATAATNPGVGAVRANGLPAVASAVYINQTDALAVNMGPAIANWANSTSAVKGQLTLRSQQDLSQQVVFDVTSVTDNTGWYTIAVTYRGGAATLAASIPVSLDFSSKGDKGDPGIQGPAGAGSTVFAALAGVSTGTARPTLNFQVGEGVKLTVADNAGQTRTDITVTAIPMTAKTLFLATVG